jgi:hypothetical protein
MITYLELGLTDGVSVSLVSPLPWRSAEPSLLQQAVRLSQVVRQERHVT